jgi:uncharacterized protein YndB with AHSA1/START domain
MIEISVDIKAPITKVWEKWTDIEAVQYWSFASDDWAAEGIENNVEVGGVYKARNYAKDGSMEFTLTWTYSAVEPQKHLAYTMEDGRKVVVDFVETEQGTRIDQAFDPESENPESMQRDGWQAYLNNFKKFVESTQE